MDQLVQSMKVVLANTFALYLRGHYYHWNVEGSDFRQYHLLFGDFYEEVYGAVDKTAEEIRALDAYAPGSLKRFLELSQIEGDESIPSNTEMARRLMVENEKMIQSLVAAYKLAEQDEQLGLANFLQDRIDAHRKHRWMLKASTK